jgi:hypothetical protein
MIVSILPMVGYLAAAALAVMAMEAAMDARLTWVMMRALRRASGAGAKLDLESRFVVRLGDSEVVCERPDGTHERVAWHELQRVEIVSTSDDPMVPDTFWLLDGKTSGCAIPWGATGEVELLQRLQELPGFDHQAIVGAASNGSNARRLCWQRAS